MRAAKRLVALAVVVLTLPRLTHAAAVASDNACNAGYSGAGDWTGNNGGTGFAIWTNRIVIGSGSFLRGSSSVNGGSTNIDTSCSSNVAWCVLAGGGNGNTASVVRVFTAGTTPTNALQVGQTFQIDLDCNFVDNGNPVGFALQNSSGQNVFDFTFRASQGFQTNGLAVNGASSANCGVPYQSGNGLRLIFTLTATNTCQLQVLNPSNSVTIATFPTISLQSPAGGQAIDRVKLFSWGIGSGNNWNAYFNSMSVNCPTFTVSTPTNQNVCAGTPVSFFVAASTTDSPTYQWQISTNGSVWNAVSSGTGGTTTNYTTDATVLGDNGKMYRCAVSTACGNTIASAPATLGVFTAPVVTTQPANQTVYETESASFNVVAAVASSYQWYTGTASNGVALSNGGSISGVTGATLTLNGLATGDSGANFYAVMTGCGTFQTSSVTVSLNVLTGTAPFITTPLTPASFSNSVGSQVTFTAAFGGPLPITYRWQFNDGGTNVFLSGATNASLLLLNLQVGDSGTYTLIASNAFGATPVSTTVTITPLPPGVFDVQNYFSSEFHPKDNGWYTAPWSESDPGWRYKLDQQPTLLLTQPGGPPNATIITVNPSVTYQTVTGIGTSLDESSCYAIQKNHTDDQIKNILREWLDPDTGTGYSLFRICIGTSDFADARSVSSNPQGWYSYQDVQNGPFSITNDVRLGIIRVIKLAQQVLQESGQQMRIFGSTWSPPGWMKDSGVMTGGNLLSTMYTQFAIYIKNFVQAYEALGIPIYAITINNEHYFSTGSYPSCTFNATAEGALVEEIGKQFRTNSLSTRIWILDHNWDLQGNAQQTLSYLQSSTPNGEGYGFCDATAFHHYGGSPTDMTTLHNAYPNKDIQFTEGSVWGTSGINEVVQMFRNWCKSYMVWVPMVTQNPSEHIQGPYNTVGPLSPTIYIKTEGSGPDYYRTPEYYLIGQLSKFVRPGAVRIDSSSAGPISNVAFQNPDGRIVVVVVNQNSSAQNFRILCQANQITAIIPGGTVATYLFNAGVTSTNPPPPVMTVETNPNGTGVIVPAQSLTAGASINVYAVARDTNGVFMANVPAAWSVQNITGSVTGGDLLPSGDNKSATFTAHLVGTGVIQVFAGTAGQSGVQTVVKGVASQTKVESKADGTGVIVPAQSLAAGSSLNAYAIIRDAGGNFITNAPATWSLQNVSGGVVNGDLLPSADTKNAAFTAHLFGSAVIQAVASNFTGQSGALTVDSPGPVAALTWATQPGSAVSGFPFNQQPVIKTVDQFGNPSTLGLAATLNVTVALGAGTGPLLGTTNYNIGTTGGNGMVNFTDLQINTSGAGKQLRASMGTASAAPGSIANCQLWLDANDLSTLTLGVTNVTMWADKSGLNNNATGGNAPTFGTNANLSVPGRVVRFNGTANYLNVNLSALAGQPYTILALEVNGVKSSNNSYFIGNTGGSTDQALHMGYYNSTTFRLGQWSDDLSYNGTYTGTTTPRLWSGKLDTNAGRFMYLNGNQVATFNSTNKLSGTLTSGHIGGAFDTSTSLYRGDLAEIAVYNRALSDAERASVENYFVNKWLPGYSSTAVSTVFAVQGTGSETNNGANQITWIQLFSGTNVVITVPSVAGETYQLQYSSSMSPTNWVDVPGALVTNSLGSTLMFTNFGGASQSQGFYRLRITTIP